MKLGTSSVIVAAFVGPGTVLTCASAGVGYGYQLAWVLLFATASVFVLQSFTAGTGVLARRGLGEALRETITSRTGRAVAFGLVVLGLWVGCAAFELGNLLGAASGVALLTGWAGDLRWLVTANAGLVALLLLLDLRWILRMLTALVAGMSLLFISAFAVAPTDGAALVRGLFVPRVPDGSLLTVLALVGTTIVTYNLFLHSAVAKAYWAGTTDARRAWRRELAGMAVFLPIGGLISLAILAAGAPFAGKLTTVARVTDFAVLLEPVAGPAARVLFGLGLFAAGLTSAMTAPLAAAAGVCELFGWPETGRDVRYRLVWGSVVGTGVLFGLGRWSPLAAIVAAQAANGILLPLIAGFVLFLSVRQTVLPLPRWYQALGALVVLVCAGLGLRTLWWVWDQLTH